MTHLFPHKQGGRVPVAGSLDLEMNDDPSGMEDFSLDHSWLQIFVKPWH